MQFINPIYLIKKSTIINSIGDSVDNKTIERKVIADVESIKQSEFYQAQATGFKPELTFIVRKFEYKEEELLKFNSKIYRIIRTYDRCDGNIELVCTGVVNNVGTKECY